MYVTTKEDSSVGAGTHSVPIIEPDRRSLMKKNLALAERLITAQFESSVTWNDVTMVTVDAEEESDEYTDDEQETITIFSL